MSDDPKVHPIRKGVLTHSSAVEEVMQDLGEFADRAGLRHYVPEYGVVVFKDATGRVCTHTLGSMTNIELLGILSCAHHLHATDSCSSTTD